MKPKAKIVCDCLGVTEADLLKAIETRRIQSLEDIIEYTSAGEGCTACHPALLHYLKRAREKKR